MSVNRVGAGSQRARLAVYPTIERAAWALSRWLAHLEERGDS